MSCPTCNDTGFDARPFGPMGLEPVGVCECRLNQSPAQSRDRALSERTNMIKQYLSDDANDMERIEEIVGCELTKSRIGFVFEEVRRVIPLVQKILNEELKHIDDPVERREITVGIIGALIQKRDRRENVKYVQRAVSRIMHNLSIEHEPQTDAATTANG